MKSARLALAVGVGLMNAATAVFSMVVIFETIERSGTAGSLAIAAGIAFTSGITALHSFAPSGYRTWQTALALNGALVLSLLAVMALIPVPAGRLALSAFGLVLALNLAFLIVYTAPRPVAV